VPVNCHWLLLEAYRLIVQWLELFKVYGALAILLLNYRHCVKPIERTAPVDLAASARTDKSVHTNEDTQAWIQAQTLVDDLRSGSNLKKSVHIRPVIKFVELVLSEPQRKVSSRFDAQSQRIISARQCWVVAMGRWGKIFTFNTRFRRNILRVRRVSHICICTSHYWQVTSYATFSAVKRLSAQKFMKKVMSAY